MRQIRDALLDLVALAGAAVLISGCSLDQQLLLSAATKKAEVGVKEYHDREAEIAIQLPCSSSVGGAIRSWNMQQLVNQLENCGLDLRDLYAELSIRQRPADNLY